MDLLNWDPHGVEAVRRFWDCLTSGGGGPDVGQQPLEHCLAFYTAWIRGVPALRASTRVHRSTSEPQEIRRLRETILTGKLPRRPQLVPVKGTFFPSLLLCSGWWDREDVSTAPDLRTNIQSWLYYGFEQWAPSWDVTPALDDEANNYMLAQLGDGDEADSMAVVVCGREKVRQVRALINEHMVGDKVVPFEAIVSGEITHRSEVPSDPIVRDWLRSLGKTFNFCILLKEDDPRHQIEPVGESEVYSGYLWKCLAPKQWIIERHDLDSFDDWKPNVHRLKLLDVYFVWEHTNFAKLDAVKYNLESLEFKTSYLERRHPEGLVLLEKSSPLVEGESVYSKEELMRVITKQA
jgi:hypothetical protein